MVHLQTYTAHKQLAHILNYHFFQLKSSSRFTKTRHTRIQINIHGYRSADKFIQSKRYKIYNVLRWLRARACVCVWEREGCTEVYYFVMSVSSTVIVRKYMHFIISVSVVSGTVIVQKYTTLSCQSACRWYRDCTEVHCFIMSACQWLYRSTLFYRVSGTVIVQKYTALSCQSACLWYGDCTEVHALYHLSQRCQWYGDCTEVHYFVMSVSVSVVPRLYRSTLLYHVSVSVIVQKYTVLSC